MFNRKLTNTDTLTGAEAYEAHRENLVTAVSNSNTSYLLREETDRPYNKKDLEANIKAVQEYIDSKAQQLADIEWALGEVIESQNQGEFQAFLEKINNY